jgi:formate dehydrogenase major subunit
MTKTVRELLAAWPVARQLTGNDRLGLGDAVRSERSATLEARTETADRVVPSVCPYCAVGCGQRVYVKDEKVIQIEGDPDSPISRGRLCPKGAASRSLHESPRREYKVKYRRPHGTEWEELELDTAMDMIADRLIAAREAGWEDTDDQGRVLNRTLGFAHLGGATLDNEENYLIKKFFSAMGALQIENQARI